MKKAVLINLQKSCASAANKIAQQLDSSTYPHDTRYVVLKSFSDTIVPYILLQDIFDSNTLTTEKNYGLQEEGSRVKIPKENIAYFTELVNLELRSGFFISTIVGFEIGLRSIGSALGITKYKINPLYTELISITELGTDYLNLLNIIFYSRNSIQNGGILTDNPPPLTFKDRTFDLSTGPLKLKDTDFEFVFSEFIEFWIELCKTVRLSGISFIEHPYITQINLGNN